MNKEYTLKGVIETRTSKNGNSYQCLVIKLANNYEKVVFLDRAEQLLLEMTNTK